MKINSLKVMSTPQTCRILKLNKADLLIAALTFVANAFKSLFSNCWNYFSYWKRKYIFGR